MANRIVDVLITEFRAKTSGLTTGVGKGIKALRKFGGVTRSVFSSLLNAARTMTIVGGIITGVLVAVSKKAIDAYNQLDSFRLTIQALNTDAEDASRSMERLMNIGMTQPGATVKGMFEGYSQLFSLVKDSDWVISLLKEINNQLAFGSFNNSEGQKRIITNLAQILGAGKLTGDELRETAQLLPRFREGLLKAFGTVDSEELVKQGYSAIDILHGVMEAFNEMERAPYSSLTLWTKASDHLWLVMTKIGELLTNKLNPLMKVFIDGVQRLQSSGILDDIVDNLVAKINFEIDPTKFGFAGIVPILARILAEIEYLPERLEVFFKTYVGGLAVAVSEILRFALGMLTAINIIGSFIASLFDGIPNNVDKRIKEANDYGMAVMKGVEETRDRFYELFKSSPDGGALNNLVNQRVADLAKQLLDTEPTTPESAEIPDKPQDIVPQILGDIEENTKRTAESLEYINDTILGGGDIAARGIKATELSGLKGGRNSVDGLVARAVDLLTQAVYLGSVDTRRYLP